MQHTHKLAGVADCTQKTPTFPLYHFDCLLLLKKTHFTLRRSWLWKNSQVTWQESENSFTVGKGYWIDAGSRYWRSQSWSADSSKLVFRTALLFTSTTTFSPSQARSDWELERKWQGKSLLTTSAIYFSAKLSVLNRGSERMLPFFRKCQCFWKRLFCRCQKPSHISKEMCGTWALGMSPS